MDTDVRLNEQDAGNERPKRERKRPKWQNCYENNFISTKRKHREKWLEAIEEEMATLKENNTWKFPRYQKTVKSLAASGCLK